MMTTQDVLVIEDEPEMNELIGAYVTFSGYGYRPALTGMAALQEARRRRPALVVLDLMLPDMNGFQVCECLRDDPHTSDVPIIFLTAMADEESRKRARQGGATDYLTKPFAPDRLIACIRQHARDHAPTAASQASGPG